MLKTTEIQIVANDIGEDLHLHIDAPHDDGCTVFVQHGLAGSITDEMYLRLRRSYLDHGWNCVAVECTNSLNGAGGQLRNFTIERHVFVEQLCSVVLCRTCSCFLKLLEIIQLRPVLPTSALRQDTESVDCWID